MLNCSISSPIPLANLTLKVHTALLIAHELFRLLRLGQSHTSIPPPAPSLAVTRKEPTATIPATIVLQRQVSPPTPQPIPTHGTPTQPAQFSAAMKRGQTVITHAITVPQHQIPIKTKTTKTSPKTTKKMTSTTPSNAFPTRLGPRSASSHSRSDENLRGARWRRRESRALGDR